MLFCAAQQPPPHNKQCWGAQLSPIELIINSTLLCLTTLLLQSCLHHDYPGATLNPIQTTPATFGCPGILFLLQDKSTLLVQGTCFLIHKQHVHVENVGPCMSGHVPATRYQMSRRSRYIRLLRHDSKCDEMRFFIFSVDLTALLPKCLTNVCTCVRLEWFITYHGTSVGLYAWPSVHGDTKAARNAS